MMRQMMILEDLVAGMTLPPFLRVAVSRDPVSYLVMIQVVGALDRLPRVGYQVSVPVYLKNRGELTGFLAWTMRDAGKRLFNHWITIDDKLVKYL